MYIRQNFITLCIILVFKVNIYKCDQAIPLPKFKQPDNQRPQYDISFCKEIDRDKAYQFNSLPLLDRGHFGIVKDNYNSAIKVLKIKRKNCSGNNSLLDEDCIQQNQIEAEIYYTKNLYANLYQAQSFGQDEFLSYEQDYQKFIKNFVKIYNCYTYKSQNSIYYFLELEKLDFDLGFFTNDIDLKYQQPKNNSKGEQVTLVFQRSQMRDEIYVIEVIMNLFQQLSVMHDQDLVHGDIQPENILARMNKKSQNLSDENLRKFFEQHQIQLILADYGLMKKEGEITLNFSKIFSHPSLLLNYDTYVPLTKNADVYSLCLTLLTINSYRKDKVGTYFYGDLLKQQLEELNPDDVTYEIAEQAYVEGFKRMFNILKNKNFAIFDEGNLRQCTTYVCILLKGIKLDINQIPSAKDIYQQLKRLHSYSKIIMQERQQRSIWEVQQKFSGCYYVDQGHLYDQNQDQEEFEMRDDCVSKQNQNQGDQVHNMDLQFRTATLGSDFYYYIIVLIDQYKVQFSQHFNMDYDHANQLYNEQSCHNLTLLQRYYCNMDFTLKNQKIQFYSKGYDTKYFVENFLNLFKGLQKIQSLGFVFNDIEPKRIVQPTMINNIKFLDLKFVLMPIYQAGMSFGYREFNNLNIFKYPSFDYQLYDYRLDNFSLSLSCLYIFFGLSNPSLDIMALLKIGTDSVTNLRRKKFQYKDNHSKLMENLPEIQQQYDGLKEKYFKALNLNVLSLLRHIFRKFVDDEKTCEKQNSDESILVCILLQCIKENMNDMPDTKVIIDQLQNLEQKIKNNNIII